MKKNGKKAETSEHSKRLMFYLSLLAAAAFFAFTGPGNAWLAIGLSAGILISLLIDVINRWRDRKNAANGSEVSTETEETVENEDGETNTDEKKEQ